MEMQTQGRLARRGFFGVAVGTAGIVLAARLPGSALAQDMSKAESASAIVSANARAFGLISPVGPFTEGQLADGARSWVMSASEDMARLVSDRVDVVIDFRGGLLAQRGGFTLLQSLAASLTEPRSLRAVLGEVLDAPQPISSEGRSQTAPPMGEPVQPALSDDSGAVADVIQSIQFLVGTAIAGAGCEIPSANFAGVQ